MRQALSNGHQIVVEVGKSSDKKYWYDTLTHSGFHYISILGIDLSNNKAYVGNSGRYSSGWFNLNTLVHAQGTALGKGWSGWIEIRK